MVSVVITRRKSDSEVELDTFLLSCRVMGRFIEDRIIGFIEDLYKKAGYKKFITYYRPTEKNAPVKDLFERLVIRFWMLTQKEIKNMFWISGS